MQRPAKKSIKIRTLSLCLFAFVLTALIAVGAITIAWTRGHARNWLADRYYTTGVRRADLFPTLTASGRIESAKRTVIECELENVAVGIRGPEGFCRWSLGSAERGAGRNDRETR